MLASACGSSETMTPGRSSASVATTASADPRPSGTPVGTPTARTDAGCPKVPACDAAPPVDATARTFRHRRSTLVVASGAPNHRGRDMFYNPGDPVWVMAKLAYGTADKDLKDEDVDVYLDRDCGGTWQKIGTATSTKAGGAAPTREGVVDTGGWVYFEVPASVGLGEGRHRFHLFVPGDRSSTDVLVDVVPKGTPIVVSDVDGTLTTAEDEELGAFVSGVTPQANEGAPEALRKLADKGYRVMYLTARPEFLVTRTRTFLKERGFPEGLVHTTLTTTGATKVEAAAFKSAELSALAARGLVPAYGFGNTPSDATAYDSAAIKPKERRVFHKYTDAAYGGRRIESYTELHAEVDALPPACGAPAP